MEGPRAWALYLSRLDSSAFIEGDKSVDMRLVRPADWERVEVVPAEELRGAVQERDDLRAMLIARGEDDESIAAELALIAAGRAPEHRGGSVMERYRTWKLLRVRPHSRPGAMNALVIGPPVEDDGMLGVEVVPAEQLRGAVEEAAKWKRIAQDRCTCVATCGDRPEGEGGICKDLPYGGGSHG
jgi:hypothetical protein